MSENKITITKKADKDEADIYKHIFEKFGEKYQISFEKNFSIFLIYFPNNPS